MSANPIEVRVEAPPTDGTGEAAENLHIAEVHPSWTPTDRLTGTAPHLDDARPGGASPGRAQAVANGWTPVHTAVARFLGECFAVGAVLGVVIEMARPLRGKRHG